MANRYWDGGTSADPTDVNNWSDTDGGGTPASSVPGTGDIANFTANGDGNVCTATANWALGGLIFLVGYTSKFDLVTFNLTMDDGADVILDGGGEFDNGTGSHSITNGTLDNKDQNTFSRGTSTWTFNGVCTMIGHSSKSFNNLFFVVGSVITIDVSTTARVVVRGICTINGDVVLNHVLAIAATGEFVINENVSFSGSSYLYLLTNDSGKGLTTLHSSVSMPITHVSGSVLGTVLVAGTWGGLLKILALGAVNTTLELDNDTYNFNGGLELENIGTGVVTLQNKTNNPTINVTDLTIDRDDGTIVIDDDATAVDWTITGDVIDEAATGFTWTPGTGTVDLSGAADQAVDFMDQDCGQLVINKSAGTVDIEAADCELGSVDMVDNLTFTNSIISSSDIKNITGDVDFTDAGNDINLGAATWNITDGAWNVVGAGAWTIGTSTVTFVGTCTINTGTTNDFYNLTVTSGIATISTNNTQVRNVCTINGTLSINTGKKLWIYLTALSIGDGGRLTGDGTGSVHFYVPAAGKGVTAFHANGIWDIPQTLIQQPNIAAVLAPGNYQSAVKVYNTSNTTDYTLTLTATGVYQFDSLELETTGSNTLTLDNNSASITINGDLIFDRDSTGVITINDSVTNWIITGDVIDQSASGITWNKGSGTITAEVSTYLKNGGGFDFNGSSDEVDINAQVHDFSTDFTIAAWIRIPSVTSVSSRQIFTQGVNCRFHLNTIGRLTYGTDGDVTSSGSSLFTANTWHYIMVTYDDSGTNVVKLYVDNVEQATEDKTAANTAADSRIGSYLGGSSWFKGHIADLRVFDKAISSTERAELYNSGNGTTDAVATGNCIGWWAMDEFAAGKTVVDSSSASNDGTSIQNTNIIRADYDQDWDWMGASIEDIIINKTANTRLTLSGAVTTASFTGTTGEFDPNGQTITITGDCTWIEGFEFAAGATTMNGCTWIIGGNFAAKGQSLLATASWDLQVTGRAVVSGVATVEYSDASGYTTIIAYQGPSVDGGNNVNWLFAPILARSIVIDEFDLPIILGPQQGIK